MAIGQGRVAVAHRIVHDYHMGSMPLEDLRRALPWLKGFQEVVRNLRPAPFSGSHLLMGSDYAGSVPRSNYLSYSFILVDADLSPLYPANQRQVRRTFLPDGRRMSFKRLGDRHRASALIPFLDSAETLFGVCLAVLVHKGIEFTTTTNKTLQMWQDLGMLTGKWTIHAFEQMARTVSFASVLVSECTRPGQHLTWITDQDAMVANDDRLTDVMELAARMIGLYVSFSLGEFAMNTAAVYPGERSFEDFVAIPDLVAGAFAEIVTSWSREPSLRAGYIADLDSLHISPKARAIASWFFDRPNSLARGAIILDKIGPEKYQVRSMTPMRIVT